jgi:hypothetical protein
VAAIALLGACLLDTSGAGSGSGAMPGGEGGTSSSAGGAELESSTAAGSGQADGVTTGATDPTGGADEPPSSSTGSSEGGDDTTTGPAMDPCENPAPFTVQLDVTQAVITPPMQLGNYPPEGNFAYSEVAYQGRASFEFDLTCQVEVRAWARVFDPGVGEDGLEREQPDSYFIAFDGEADTEWWYSCQVFNAAPSGAAWAWAQLMDNAGCGTDEFRRTLPAGKHHLNITNREAGELAEGNVAAFTRVVITSDPGYVPS